MLWFIGLGVSGISELSDRTLSVIKNAKIVYLESFTSPISETEKEQLKNICSGEFKIARRWLVEDGNEILENAKKRETDATTNWIKYNHRNDIANIEPFLLEWRNGQL